MNTVIITLGALLAGAAFIAGRSCLITERLRKRVEAHRATITALRCDKERTDGECSMLSTALVSLQNPFSDLRRTFAVRELCEGCFVVTMSVELHGRRTGEKRTVTIPVKPFSDREDPDFALREAEEFMEKCEEA